MLTLHHPEGLSLNELEQLSVGNERVVKRDSLMLLSCDKCGSSRLALTCPLTTKHARRWAQGWSDHEQ